LQSKKGKGGGYYLDKPPGEIRAGNVIRNLDGPLAPVPCVSVTAYAKCYECLDERNCGIRLVMKGVRDAISNILGRTSLADMLERKEKQAKKEKRDFGFSHLIYFALLVYKSYRHH
jgi:Rrf2 family protein